MLWLIAIVSAILAAYLMVKDHLSERHKITRQVDAWAKVKTALNHHRSSHQTGLDGKTKHRTEKKKGS